MKFLHEYHLSPSGVKHYNGYWEIDGGRLVNRAGGWHPYNPSPDDEIIELDSWADLIRLTIKDDTQITGWIAPNGDFYGCRYSNHADLAEYLLGATEEELEERGYCKIYSLQLLGSGYHYYVRNGHLTEAQEKVLIDKGLTL